MKLTQRFAALMLLVFSLSTNPKPVQAGQIDNSIVTQFAVAALALLHTTWNYALEMEILRERAALNAGPQIDSIGDEYEVPLWELPPSQDWLMLQIRAARNELIYGGQLPDLEMIQHWFGLIQNPAQDIIDFVKGLGWYNQFPNVKIDSSLTFQLPKEQKQRADQGKPAILASERLALAKKLLKANPNLTMKTKIGNGSLWAIYEADKYFILTNTANRTDADYIRHCVEELDQAIKEEGLDQAMSFADYALIARSWTSILSVHPTKKLGFSPPAFKVDAYKKMKNRADQQPKFINSPGIFFPHISRTGLAPIRVINDGWGFSTGYNRVSYVDFGGVATDEYINFDLIKDVVSFTGWRHDITHAEYAGRLGDKKLDPISLARKAASLRETAIQYLVGFDEQLALFEFAFFEVFHESMRQIENLAQEIEDRLDETKKSLSQAEADSFGHEPMIKEAQHLGIKLAGDQRNACLQKLIEGLNILASYAHFYDESDFLLFND